MKTNKKMKKFTAVVLSALLAFSFAGCGKKAENTSSGANTYDR